MTQDKFVPISQDLAAKLIDLLSGLSDYPIHRHRAADLLRHLGEACTIAGEHRRAVDMHATELLEAIAQASGRHFETIPSVATVKAAKQALAEMGPELGANVIPLPRVPDRDTQTAIESAATKAFLDAPPPITVIVVCDGRQMGQRAVFEAPVVGDMVVVSKQHEGERLPRAKRLPVLERCWLDARTIVVQVGRATAEPVPEWMARAAGGEQP